MFGISMRRSYTTALGILVTALVSFSASSTAIWRGVPPEQPYQENFVCSFDRYYSAGKCTVAGFTSVSQGLIIEFISGTCTIDPNNTIDDASILSEESLQGTVFW
jgi:hypothetical protein